MEKVDAALRSQDDTTSSTSSNVKQAGMHNTIIFACLIKLNRSPLTDPVLVLSITHIQKSWFYNIFNNKREVVKDTSKRSQHWRKLGM